MPFTSSTFQELQPCPTTLVWPESWFRLAMSGVLSLLTKSLIIGVIEHEAPVSMTIGSLESVVEV